MNLQRNCQDKYPQVGDLIRSPRFTKGYYANRVWLPGLYKYWTDFDYPDPVPNLRIADIVSIFPRNNNSGDCYDKSCHTADDDSRANVTFIVELAWLSMVMDYSDSDFTEVKSRSWNVVARRLNGDRSYNPKGELIEFDISIVGGQRYDEDIQCKDIEICGKMERRFI